MERKHNYCFFRFRKILKNAPNLAIRSVHTAESEICEVCQLSADRPPPPPQVFLDFLRLCLESEDKRPTVQELMEHAFIAGDPSAQGVFGPQVGLLRME